MMVFEPDCIMIRDLRVWVENIKNVIEIERHSLVDRLDEDGAVYRIQRCVNVKLPLETMVVRFYGSI